jgi:hypothetical protein
VDCSQVIRNGRRNSGTVYESYVQLRETGQRLQIEVGVEENAVVSDHRIPC